MTDAGDYAEAVAPAPGPGRSTSPRLARPTIALVTDQPDAPLLGLLTSAGWSVTGRVHRRRLRRAAVGRADARASRATTSTCPSCSATPTSTRAAWRCRRPTCGSTLVATLQAGLHTLLPEPAELGADAVRRALEAAEDSGAEHAVAMQQRWRAPVARVARALDSGELGPPAQLTVRGWPTGAAPTAELLDVVTRWCGDVVAVCATPDELPARELPGGATVRWAC